MYEELVKALRICEIGEHCDLCPKWEDKQNGGMNVCLTAICKEAANAIEELICEVADEHNARLDVEERQRWIPVTERLPKEEEEIYWCYTNMGIMCECRWTNNRWGLGESDKWGWNIMDVPQYQKVTHWMPQPEPPKEE